MVWIEKIKSYTPYDEKEKQDKQAILFAINNFENLLTRDNLLAHITSSGYIVNKSRSKVLTVHHNIYNTWSWTGGHADSDEDLLYVAIKEAIEETGVKNVKAVTEEILSFDIINVREHMKRGNYVSAHLHINVTYLLEADEEEKLVVKKDENSGVMWIPIEEVCKYSNEQHMIHIYNKINEKIKLKNL